MRRPLSTHRMRRLLLHVLSIGAAIVLVAGLRPQQTDASEVTEAYRGLASDFSSIVISHDTELFGTRLEFTLTAPSELAACGKTAVSVMSSDRGKTYRYDGNGVTVTVVQTSIDPLLKNAAFSGTFSDTRAAGSTCPTRTLTWAVMATRGDLGQPLIGSTYTGTGVSFRVGAGVPNPTPSAFERTLPPAGIINGLQIEATSGSCSYAASFIGTLPAAGFPQASSLREADPAKPAKQSMAYGIFSGAKAMGVFVQSQGAGASCAPVITAWSATTPPFAGTPTFSAGGQAAAIFKGGTVDELEEAARVAGATGVWAQDPAGTFQLLLVRGPFFLKKNFDQAMYGTSLQNGPFRFMISTAVTLQK